MSTITRKFNFGEDTCKREWVFTLSETEAGLVIEDIKITPHYQNSGQPRGCQGHPKTIVALLKQRTLDSIDIDELSKSTCVLEFSCGQALAECLEKLKQSIN